MKLQVYKNLALVPLLIQRNPVYTPSYFCKINFSIVLPSVCSLQMVFFLGVFQPKCLHFSSHSCIVHALSFSALYPFDDEMFIHSALRMTMMLGMNFVTNFAFCRHFYVLGILNGHPKPWSISFKQVLTPDHGLLMYTVQLCQVSFGNRKEGN